MVSPKVLLAIVTWNHERSIKETIDSVYRLHYDSFKLVVFDNNSSDGTVGILKEYEARADFTLIQSSENKGFCGGNNFIISRFDFDFILLVNPDIVLTPDYLERVISCFEKDQSIGAVCGLLVQSKLADPVIDSAGMTLLRDRRFSLNYHGKKISEVQLSSGYVDGLDGALPMFRKEAVRQLLIQGDFFNPLFFSHKEDWDISWRMLLYGWKIYFETSAIAVHPRGFKPNRLKERQKMNSVVKYDAFKNQFLLMLINDDGRNFFRDSLLIVSRIVFITLYCVLFERYSLNAYSFVFKYRKQIRSYRMMVQSTRKIDPTDFRNTYLSERKR